MLIGPPVQDMNAGAPLDSEQLRVELLNPLVGDVDVRTAMGVAMLTVE